MIVNVPLNLGKFKRIVTNLLKILGRLGATRDAVVGVPVKWVFLKQGERFFVLEKVV